MTTQYRIFAGVTPGLETLLERELSALGLADPRTAAGGGGVELNGDGRALWTVALWSRLAESLRVRLGRSFRATTFDQLAEGARKLPWAAFLPRRAGLAAVRVSCRKSRLYHSDAVAERLTAVLATRLESSGAGPDSQLPAVQVRIHKDQVQISVDASGELLHRRGYRSHIGDAPLRETLAAACLLAAGVTPAGLPGKTTLWDPFCGAGTIPLEALGILTGVAPGGARRFAFEQWPTHDTVAYEKLKRSLPAASSSQVSVLGSDVSDDAIRAARHNANKAGLADRITLTKGDFEEVSREVPEGAMVVTNPPYGRRLREVESIYRRLGKLLRRRDDLRPGFVLTGFQGVRRAIGLSLREIQTFKNRGLAVRLFALH